jgi:UDP-N-acetylglucosamine--N-acetylmuramyl-(pentapeptide) pyrophosphoryl-undecaprenol N-acetylglucosamine transferase
VGVRGKAEDSMVRRAWVLHEGEEATEGRAAWDQARRNGLKFVRSRGFPGLGNPVALARFVFDLGLGVVKALVLLLSYRPTVIIGTGGYVAAPILMAAFGLRKLGLVRSRIFIHEQNVVLGRMNRLAAGFADKVGVAFSDTRVDASRKVCVGYPVRSTVTVDRDETRLTTAREEARQALDLPADARVILAFGGSQGARTINRVMVDALPSLLKDPRVFIFHGTGKQLAGNSYNGARDVAQRLEGIEGLPADLDRRYHRMDFIHDMGRYYAASDLVVCRGGAGSLSEVCAQGKAAVVIPKANLPGDHQTANALSLERRGAVRVVYERVDLQDAEAVEVVDADALTAAVMPLLDNDELRGQMATTARAQHEEQTLEWIAEVVEHLVAGTPMPVLPEPPPATHEEILGLDSNGLDHKLRGIRDGLSTLDAGQRALILYKIDGYLAAPGYVSRARGCRMVGNGGYTERLDILLSFATGRRNTGAYRQLPIVRRDAFVGLQHLGVVDDEVIEALGQGMSDPYFEACAKAMQAVAGLDETDAPRGSIFSPRGLADVATPAQFAPLVPHLLRGTTHEFFETRVHAVRALSRVTMNFSEVRDTLRALYFDPRWKVRMALFRAYGELVARQVLSTADARQEADQILRTSDGFDATFGLKVAMRDAYLQFEKGHPEGSA